MLKESNALLPDEFIDGPWITAHEVMTWLGISKPCLKTWRARGVLAYTTIAGTTLYNKPWILQLLKEGWKRNVPQKK